jgi:hypothetical protein
MVENRMGDTTIVEDTVLSYWIEITDPDDITIDGEDVDIRYNSKDGNQYITIKIDVLYEKLKTENIDLIKKWKEHLKS